jgi:predicted RNase H-like HicB family nuclease
MTNSEHDRYPVEVFWSDEDEGFIAVARDLPGCSAWGESREDALTELRAAIDVWISAAKAAGNPIPAPSRPALTDSYSGKFLVRMGKSLHARLARDAEVEGVSLNQHVVQLLSYRAGERAWHRNRQCHYVVMISHDQLPIARRKSGQQWDEVEAASWENITGPKDLVFCGRA